MDFQGSSVCVCVYVGDVCVLFISLWTAFNISNKILVNQEKYLRAGSAYLGTILTMPPCALKDLQSLPVRSARPR